MPNKLHRTLAERAERMGLNADQKDAYVYSTLRKVEEMPNKKKKPKTIMQGGGKYGK